ncbi:molybdate ABC transporter substrate-binding protein [Bacillus sp. HMF5848]|uniref:molybdate ABC transporter substrate-binding protein n=1 Tax=Bacillus sp. HMF5848 TaxID=2495421 RepID=UPI000F770418|nr:molybdate ABC transporter substrate-binding protein [Bacillus sp. HMF5848]RSK26249.1 molybdate ABC transporter substrate-binding protein [Bacillus sp. HMF5848]
MKRFKLVTVILFVFLFLIGCNNQGASESTSNKHNKKSEVLVSAAASLTDALLELEKTFESTYTSVDISYNFGGSGTLAQQILQGAPTDVFLSANQNWMDTLEAEEHILPETRINFTGNKIVLIAQKEKSYDINSFEDINQSPIGQISIGNPDSVPAGKYAKESLVSIGKWEQLQEKVVLAKDVRQVLAYVQSGNTDLGFVYSSDASISERVEILAEANSDWHTPIVYPAAVIADSDNAEAAKLFVQFLQTDAAKDILAQYGFK